MERGPRTREIRSALRARLRTKRLSEASEPEVPRKTPRQARARPYRKPTQVGGENIPRRSGQPWSRNSAQWPRNFGRRGARAYVNRLARGAEAGRSGEAQATVYQKHRTLQKPQGDV